MELDLEHSGSGEMTERSESSLIKQPSPTTEKAPFTPGNHGDGFPGNLQPAADDNYNYQSEMNGDSVQPETMTGQNLVASEESAPEKVLTSPTFAEDSDPEMPPLEYDAQEASVLAENLKNKERSETQTSGETPPSQDQDEEWLDILGNGLLKKKVLVSGQGVDTRPLRNERVVLDIQGTLDDGTEVENQVDYRATMAEGDFITAVDMCVALMEKGETCELKTDPKYAYGKIGHLPTIPSDAHLNYTLTLKDVQPPLELETLSIEERIKLGTAKRERGNFYFARNEHPQALTCYNKAIEILRRPERLDSSVEEVDSEELQELVDVEAKCYNNLAAAQLKMEAYDAAIISSDGVIRLQPNNVKALFRKGKALAGKGDLDAAIAILRQALKIEPESKLIHTELSRLVGEQRGEAHRERDLYKKMFAQNETPAEPASNNNTTLLILGLLALLLAVIMGSLVYNNRQDL